MIFGSDELRHVIPHPSRQASILLPVIEGDEESHNIPFSPAEISLFMIIGLDEEKQAILIFLE